MIAKRVIPCLDVHDGQVTRGVRFGIAEAGDDDADAAIDGVAVSDDRAGLVDHDAGGVFDAFTLRRAGLRAGRFPTGGPFREQSLPGRPFAGVSVVHTAAQAV